MTNPKHHADMYLFAGGTFYTKYIPPEKMISKEVFVFIMVIKLIIVMFVPPFLLSMYLATWFDYLYYS